MTWNYRVVRNNSNYGIKEVFYDSDNTIHSWSEDFIIPWGETKEELFEDFKLMLRAFDKPILDETDNELV